MMKTSLSGFPADSLLPPPPPIISGGSPRAGDSFPSYDPIKMAPNTTAISYNLEGIKGRLKLRSVFCGEFFSCVTCVIICVIIYVIMAYAFVCPLPE
jgi:hypothetical protein